MSLDEVDPIYFEKAYYVSPVGADKAFEVLLSAMEKQKKAGIAKAVLGTKESLILLRVKNGNMLANTLYFYDEVVKAPAVNKVKILSKELSLAVSLINEMTEKFKPENFKDEYNIKLKKAIKSKIAGNKIVVHEEKTEPSKVINLMEALQKSLKQGKVNEA